jgi:hypothetical protein
MNVIMIIRDIWVYRDDRNTDCKSQTFRLRVTVTESDFLTVSVRLPDCQTARPSFQTTRL